MKFLRGTVHPVVRDNNDCNQNHNIFISYGEFFLFSFSEALRLPFTINLWNSVGYHVKKQCCVIILIGPHGHSGIPSLHIFPSECWRWFISVLIYLIQSSHVIWHYFFLAWKAAAVEQLSRNRNKESSPSECMESNPASHIVISNLKESALRIFEQYFSDLVCILFNS